VTEAEENPFARALPRRVLARAFRTLVQPPLERCDPSLRIVRRRTAATPLPVLALVCVYRMRFAANVEAIRRQLPADARVALWGLDGVHPELARDTVGSGPGQRFELHNRMLAGLALATESWVLAIDDDVRFKRGSVGDMVRVAVRLELDLAQPAHAWNSEAIHRYTRRRMLMLARRTSFVEMGPVALFGPRGRERLLPWPETLGWPGWGIEWRWNREEQRGLRLGIVDAVTIVHLQPVAASGYSVVAAARQDAELKRAAGFEPGFDRYVDRAHWRPWQRRPERA
jgi:hypothetical protein